MPQQDTPAPQGGYTPPPPHAQAAPQGGYTPPPPGYPPQWHGAAQQHPGWRPPPPALAPNGQPLASFLDRFLAYLIDTLIYTGVSLIWSIPFMIYWFSTMFTTMNDWSRTYDPTDPASQPPVGQMMVDLYLPMFAYIAASYLLGMIFTFLYFGEYQYRQGGQTVGKRVMKIRVIPAAPDATLDRGHTTKRWGIQFVAAALVPFGNLLDGLWQLWDKPLQQCLHDKVAATVVVKVG